MVTVLVHMIVYLPCYSKSYRIRSCSTTACSSSAVSNLLDVEPEYPKEGGLTLGSAGFPAYDAFRHRHNLFGLFYHVGVGFLLGEVTCEIA